MIYVNLAAILWLTFYIISTACLIQNNLGMIVKGVNMFPLVLSIASLMTLFIMVVKEMF